MNITEIKGGVTAAKGFEAAAAAAAIKYQGRTDMALVYSEKPCHAAGTFTTNIVKAAPVKWDQKIVKESPYAQAVIVNSGIANACTVKRPQRRQPKFSAFRKVPFWWRPLASLACSFPWIA